MVKTVTNRLNVQNRRKVDHHSVVAAVVVVVVVVAPVADQVCYSSFEYEHIDRVLFLGACFNCGQEGHRSFECTEPKKAGGGGGGGGGKF